MSLRRQLRFSLILLLVLDNGRWLAGQVDVEHLVRDTYQVRATGVADTTHLLSQLSRALCHGVLRSGGWLNEVVGQALDQVSLPMQGLGGLRTCMVCGLMRHPAAGREVLRAREIGFHVIVMGGGYSMKLLRECDLRGPDAQILTLPLPLECLLFCITWGILAATGG